MYYRWGLFGRDGNTDILFRGGALFEQYLIDAFLTADFHNLDFYRYHQTDLRVEKYSTAHHAFGRDIHTSDVGHKFILPSTFKGKPRNMHLRYQNSMAIVRCFGRPSFFITFTCNPHWLEITREQKADCRGFPAQTACDRPDLTARVFHLNLTALLSDLNGPHAVFGPHVAHVHVIETKSEACATRISCSGLIIPSITVLQSAAAVDEVVSAQIPDPDNEPHGAELFDIVTHNLIHTPCSQHNPTAPCMDEAMANGSVPKAVPSLIATQPT
ncbi:hypothetical protein N7535_002050 [Penicillium sp. DV-2018c]|nr:hypothetical protein N7461_004706 [Penicillium sp. DV-2018c]KAJ5583430.1 hypothetical protein N7535_002050 [Penicillium sp. DV-2018c]